jgi:hypothetical protein
MVLGSARYDWEPMQNPRPVASLNFPIKVCSAPQRQSAFRQNDGL